MSAALNAAPARGQAAFGHIPSAFKQEETLVILTLNSQGIIRGCNRAGERLFGWAPGKLVWQHISTLLPQLADIALMRNGEVNPRLKFLTHIGCVFELVRWDGARLAGRIFINNLESSGHDLLRMIIRPAEDYEWLLEGEGPADNVIPLYA